ncbi:hypothetical protein ACFQMM_03765 [Saliphagus sp. GCM10025308]
MTSTDAAQLRDQLADALSRTRTFTHTEATHRPDGSYVVARRGATSSGHRKVFDSFEAVVDLFEALPATFTADDVGRTGLSGSRRHILVWHVLEHPEFPCELRRRQPLTARKV